MRRASVLIAVSIWVTTVGSSFPQAAPQPPASRNPPRAASTPQALVNQYCVTCHNERTKAGGLILANLDLANASANGAVLEKMVRKLRVGLMPPPDAPRPDRATYDAFASSLETELDREAAAHPNPGRPLLHRLNRAEYANAIRDLLALDLGDITALLPPDDSAFGFDNIADVLGVSPLLLERYLNAAGKISSVAVGERDVAPGSETYEVRQDLSQDQHIEGLPFGTVGGLRVRHTFPLDGEYTFQIKLFRTNVDAIRGLENPHQIEFALDGQRIYLTMVGGRADFISVFPEVLPNGAGDVNRAPRMGDEIEKRLRVTVPVKAGQRDVTVAFLQQSPVVDTTLLQPYLRSSADTYNWSGLPHIESLAITGPFKAGGPGDTPSRRRIFICRPANPVEEMPCATRIIRALGRRAYRGPLTNVDLQRLLGFYGEERRVGSFESGIQAAVQRILASPKFVFRAEANPVGLAPGSIYRLSDYELASRLSFFLWSSIPDDELLNRAGQGRLKNPAILEEQVRRMLADPKAQALGTNFVGQWLQLRNLRSIIPDNNEFPDFDDNLRQAFQREAELLFQSVLNEDRNVVDLLTADYTFVNERLAKHYGIPNIYGSHFRRIPVTDEARKGLLGKGGILMVTSHANRTSPVLRGKWILENVLGAPPPPPPPVVPALKDKTDAGKARTIREQMDEHRANAFCASCHKLMDPLGFALENFDAVGAWRTKDAGARIDASSRLFEGSNVDGAVMLRQTLLQRSDVFVGTLTEKLMTYALGRGLTYHDMPVVRAVVQQAGRNNNRFSSIVLGIVKSSPFRTGIEAVPQNESLTLSTAAP